jgi:uncharacterized protein (UPF0371 family)
LFNQISSKIASISACGSFSRLSINLVTSLFISSVIQSEASTQSMMKRLFKCNFHDHFGALNSIMIDIARVKISISA